MFFIFVLKLVEFTCNEMCYINIIGLAVVKTSLVEKEEEKKTGQKIFISRIHVKKVKCSLFCSTTDIVLGL